MVKFVDTTMMSGLNRKSCDLSRQVNKQAVSYRRSPSLSQLGPQGSANQTEHNTMSVPDVSLFFTQLIPDWVIDLMTHLPIHPQQCADCVNYTKHVREYVKGGTLTIFVNKLKEHWRGVLNKEQYQREDNVTFVRKLTTQGC